MDKKELNIKGLKAGKDFLVNKGYKCIDDNPNGFNYVFQGIDNSINFIIIKTYKNKKNILPKPRTVDKLRQRYEQASANWLAKHDYVSMPINFIEISILVIAKNKALVRQHTIMRG